jgi:glycosyltransferase involved in cell wall biosynthesis
MKPQVLVFIDWYKPHFKAGGPVRSMVNLVDQLGGDVDFHIVTGDRDYTATAPDDQLAADGWTVQDSGEHVWYASPAGRSLRTWRALLAIRAWDVVYINGIWSRWSSLLPLLLLRGGPQRRIVAVRGMLADGVMGQKGPLKRAVLLALRVSGCFRDVEFQATSDGEVDDIRRWIGSGATIHRIPNLGRGTHLSAAVPIAKQPGALRLVSVGRIAPEKNTLYAIERLSDLAGEVHFDLYGTIYDTGYWQRCQAAIERLASNVKVRWHGEVPPEMVPQVLAQAHAVFMPSVGENFGHSMLEALSVGRPLLISDRTPWRDLERRQAGWDLPLDRPDRFHAALGALVGMGQEQYEGMAHGAFELGKKAVGNDADVARYRGLFGARTNR